mmetsp:Transcript_37736/g.84367  ORF Transcript_37736/g.84367 Transcript_37736/m.84367 type:complete len:434 (-) Transcript_37736:103-1404(-)
MCSDPLRAKLKLSEVMDPMAYFFFGVHEYSLVCKRDGSCSFEDLGCLHFQLPGNCPSTEPANCMMTQRQQRSCDFTDWKRLADTIMKDDEVLFAVTYHWTPTTISRDSPDLNVGGKDAGSRSPDVARFRQFMDYAQPGAVLHNNCLHSHPGAVNEAGDKYADRLTLWLTIVKNNVELFQESGFKGAFVFQGCPRLDCGHAQAPADCEQHEKQLTVVNYAAAKLMAAKGIQYMDLVSTMDPNVRLPDHLHPCQIRPCGWDASMQSYVADAALGFKNATDSYLKRKADYDSERIHLQAVTQGLQTWAGSEDGRKRLAGHAQRLAAEVDDTYANLVSSKARLDRLAKSLPVAYANDHGVCPSLVSQAIQSAKMLTPAASGSKPQRATLLEAKKQRVAYQDFCAKPSEDSGTCKLWRDAFGNIRRPPPLPGLQPPSS